MRALVAVVLVALFVPLLASCNQDNGPKGPAIPKTLSLRGEIRLSGAKYVFGGLDECAGVGPYVDLYEGAYVTVTNQVGKPIAIGKVAFGLGTNYYRDVLDECTFRVTMKVPRARAYLFVVGRSAPTPASLSGLLAANGEFSFDISPPLVTQAPPP